MIVKMPSKTFYLYREQGLYCMLFNIDMDYLKSKRNTLNIKLYI